MKTNAIDAHSVEEYLMSTYMLSIVLGLLRILENMSSTFAELRF